MNINNDEINEGLLRMENNQRLVQEFQKSFNNFKNAIERKMYINKKKRISILTGLLNLTLKSLSDDPTFYSFVNITWNEFNQKQIEYINKLKNENKKTNNYLISEAKFKIISKEIMQIWNFLDYAGKYIVKQLDNIK